MQRTPLEMGLLISSPDVWTSHACPSGFALAQAVSQVSAVMTAFSVSVHSQIVRHRPV
jgi:hypothetical protein